VRYDRDVRPLLSDRCFKCHGPDASQRRAELRLDLREGALRPRKRKGPAIVPGDPQHSELWRRVSSDDPDERMPPPGSNKRPLSPRERELVRRWIADGAVYEPHWSFVPPVRPQLPQVRNAAWCRNPVDSLVLARLEKEGIEPAPEADAQTLLRRVFLDLTGLPPEPEDLDELISDTRPGAYERWVDRLLTEEPYVSRYAERMASPWLDGARYADTIGIHTDAGRQMWPWRDWVLRAFRDNMPFDRFLREQLAGDLLPEATDDQKVASGFNRAHVMTDEGGAIPEEYLVEYAVDRAATTGSVFLGLTLGCARCHAHKFDPISQDEFYAFYAFFNSIEEPGLYSQLSDPNRAFEPFMPVPTDEQRLQLAELRGALDAARAELDAPSPQEDAERAAFMEQVPRRDGISWEPCEVVAASSAGGAVLSVQPDGSVLASGANPDRDEHTLTLRTGAAGARLLLLEALPDASLPQGRLGRAENGNAVLTGVTVEAAPAADPARREAVALVWAWADHEQDDGDFAVVNVLDPSGDRGWAVDAHRRPGGRVAILLAADPFGFEGGTELLVRLRYASVYARHALGRVRVRAGRIDEGALDRLPAAAGRWYAVGPFPAESGGGAFEMLVGPEHDELLDPGRNFGFGNQYWRFGERLGDGTLNALAEGVNVTYVGRRVFAPVAREVELSLGSDDGFRLYVNGREAASRQVDRSLAADQDRVRVSLRSGANTLVLKVVNTGGQAGFYHRALARPDELQGDLVAALLPADARFGDVEARLRHSWRMAFSETYRQRREAIGTLEQRIASVDAAIPRTMIMKELPEPRQTFVLVRGVYDRPDPQRRVERGVPAALGALPPDAPRDRLGLAGWMVAPQNPLVARVTVNRLWEMLFGTGIVATSEDFGHQGEWPSHPELLDWLAVDFREGGWDVRALLRLLVTSSTYRQSSGVRPEVAARDPDNRLLAWFPRRRLTAEQVRDLALCVSGMLVERLGGPPVRPYQPPGLWQEVAMPQSNTRTFTRSEGADLWRRSLYTYWKRACPPPSLMTFDAPTRESCTIRRPSTNTPLQALVLWNDEQFVEAARGLAQRTLQDPGADDDRLTVMFRRCCGRAPQDDERSLLASALRGFRERYERSPQDAAALLEVGEAPAPEDLDPSELAAWTMMGSAMLSLSETISQR
jgi:hypothetical protein